MIFSKNNALVHYLIVKACTCLGLWKRKEKKNAQKKLLPIQWPVEENFFYLCSSPSIDSNTTLGKNSKSKHAAPEEVRLLLPGTISVTGKEQRLRSLNNKNYTERKSESWKTIGTCAHFYSFKVFWWPVLFHQRRGALSESTSCVF